MKAEDVIMQWFDTHKGQYTDYFRISLGIAQALRDAGLLDENFAKHNALVKARTVLICQDPELYPEYKSLAEEMIAEIEEVTKTAEHSQREGVAK